MKNKNLLKVSVTALFAAIICIGCFVRIPLGPVPIVLQNALCILTAVLFGGFSSCLPAALFLLSGIIGLPVFSGGTGGISILAGPTGGFLYGYFIASLISGLIAGKPSVDEKNHFKIIRISFAVITGMIIIYIPGIIHFTNWAIKTNCVPSDSSAFSYTLRTCVIPYIPGDIIKCIIIIPLALKLRPVLALYLYTNEGENND